MKSFITTAFIYFFVILLFNFGSFSSTMAQDNLVINFSNMTPHLNQILYLRVVDKSTMKEVGRTSQQITVSGFGVTLAVLEPGQSYFVDFFADLNSNGFYDVPPTDHAWRLELNNAKTGGDTLNFIHNTSFTNIDWPYLLTVNFTNMTPHVGQMLELRVEDNNANTEVGRIKLLSIPSPDFQVQIVGLKLNTEYKVQFYADLNGNGIYDIPPTDHAWQLVFTNTSGDHILDFTHNTTFTDINWKYLLTVNFKNMTPHIGQKFQLRVVRQDNQAEIGRYTLSQIHVPDFSVYVPNFELEHAYNIDFYADLNGNDLYDSPPTDHAWRLSFNSSTGDIVENFTHSTNFTDINWPNTTDVSEESGFSPDNYVLEQNFPNPFNPSTNLKFRIADFGFVSLKVYDVLGNEVATLVNEVKPAGNYKINFNASQLSSGIYFYKIQAGEFTETKKMILLK